MRKIIIVWIILVYFWISPTLANDIDLTGTWWPENSKLLIEDKFNLQQNNSTITGKYNTIDCGQVNINGFIQSEKIGINLNFDKEIDDCPRWIQIVASCNDEDCSTIQGKWHDSNHLTGTSTWVKESKGFYISNPAQNSTFYIDSQPKMPPIGVGIMQVKHKTIIKKTVWDWHENMNNGLCMLNEKRHESKNFHINERKRLNADRKKLGLPSCPKNIPSPLTEDQLLRDSIRRYNYGVEYRWEPRDGKNCAGNWILSPSCVRNPRNGCDQNYVNKVLACEIS